MEVYWKLFLSMSCREKFIQLKKKEKAVFIKLMGGSVCLILLLWYSSSRCTAISVHPLYAIHMLEMAFWYVVMIQKLKMQSLNCRTLVLRVLLHRGCDSVVVFTAEAWFCSTGCMVTASRGQPFRWQELCCAESLRHVLQLGRKKWHADTLL